MKKVNSLYCFLLLLIVNFFDATRSGTTTPASLEVKKLLSRLNKTPVKSIQNPDGEIIDCVDLHNQPAFDHPLLKNHTILMRPKSYSKRLEIDDKKPISQLWHLNGRCPKKTIPIRRTKEEDIFRASSLKSFGRKNHKSSSLKPESALNQTGGWEELAVAYVKDVKYYGAYAFIFAWNPKVQQPRDESFSQIWITAGQNIIEVGWMVSPHLYGDTKTRFFIHWTSDGHQSTGCYNLLCSGFIQTHSAFEIGSPLLYVSTYNGTQHGLRIHVWKELRHPEDGNWWLQVDDQIIGYWPKELFPSLEDGASSIEWGGRVVIYAPVEGVHTITQMGSGYFPEFEYGIAGLFNDIQIWDNASALRSPDNLANSATARNCYNGSLGKDGISGDFFYYGGPGRNHNCP